MKNSRLVRVFLAFSMVEESAFCKFLESPFFNRREDVIRLFEWLRSQKRAAADEWEKERAFSFVFPGKEFSDTELRLLMSYLFKLLEEFLAISVFRNDEVGIKQRLADAYESHNLPKDFEKALVQLEQILEKSPLRDERYLETVHQVLFDRHYRSKEIPQGDESLWQSLSDGLDKVYIAKKLRQVCLLLNRKSVYETKVEIGFLKEILSYLEALDWWDEPAIRVYYHAFQTLSGQQDPKHFRIFKSALLSHAEVFPPAELHDLHLLAINYCVRKINQGDQSFFLEVLELYKEGLRTGTLLERGELSRFTYYNIVVAGLQTGDYSWVEWFIHSYKNSLKKRYRESAYSFNLARLEYSRQRFDVALELLQRANYRDVLLNLAAKTLAMKIYYQMDAMELLLSHLDAMRTYLRRKNIVGERKANYLNIIRFTQKLTAAQVAGPSHVAQIRKEMEAAQPLTEREWLLQQLDAL